MDAIQNKYDLKIRNGAIVHNQWGTDGADAAQRYADTNKGVEIFATRPSQPADVIVGLARISG